MGEKNLQERAISKEKAVICAIMQIFGENI